MNGWSEIIWSNEHAHGDIMLPRLSLSNENCFVLKTLAICFSFNLIYTVSQSDQDASYRSDRLSEHSSKIQKIVKKTNE